MAGVAPVTGRVIGLNEWHFMIFIKWESISGQHYAHLLTAFGLVRIPCYNFIPYVSLCDAASP